MVFTNNISPALLRSTVFFQLITLKMHPSLNVVIGSGYRRHFSNYPDLNYPPFDLNHYSQRNEKYCYSWLNWSSMPTQVTIEPHNHDVLLGRGGRNNQHAGNDILRQFGRLQGENYRVASKKGKSAISRLLVRQMRELNPPARFLKRVQQTAAWEEVSEETAREKASQVLRDAVAGLLEKNFGIDDESVSIQPLPTISVDEQDLSPHSRSTRKLNQNYHPPQPDPVVSESKRRRYGADTTHERSSSLRQHVVGCSPLRRHAEMSCENINQDSIVYVQTPTYRSNGNVKAASALPTGQHSGNLDEFALLHGELLESDVDDEASIFRGHRE